MKYYPTYPQSIVLLIIWFLCTMVSALIVMAFVGMDLKIMENGAALSAMYTLSMVLTVVAGLILRGNWSIPMKSFPVSVLFLALLLIVALNILLDPLTSLAPDNEMLLKLFEGMKRQPAIFFFMAVIAAPILEELMFRGIILDGYLKNYKPLHGILVSALLFGLIHGNLAQGIGAFVLGIVFGWIYWKTQSILPVILLHFVNNGIAFFGTLTLPQEDLTKSLRESMENDLAYFGLYAACAAGAFLITRILVKKFPADIETRTDESSKANTDVL